MYAVGEIIGGNVGRGGEMIYVEYDMESCSSTVSFWREI